MPVAPVRARARVEQHARDGKVEADAGEALGVLLEAAGKLLPQIGACDLEVPPSRMGRNMEVRMPRLDDIGDIARRLVQAVFDDPEVLEVARISSVEDVVAALDHRIRRHQPGDGIGRIRLIALHRTPHKVPDHCFHR